MTELVNKSINNGSVSVRQGDHMICTYGILFAERCNSLVVYFFILFYGHMQKTITH